MMRFTIRDLLLVTAIVAFAICWWCERMSVQQSRATWQAEKAALVKQHDADMANERRVATMRALEAHGKLVSPRGTGTAPTGRFSNPQSPLYIPDRP